MSDRNHDESARQQSRAGAATAAHGTQAAHQQPAVGKMSLVQAELGNSRGKAGSVAPVAHDPIYAPPTDSLSLGPDNEPRANAGHAGAARPGVWQQLASTVPASGLGGTAHVGSAAPAAQSSFSKIAFQAEVELGPLKLTAIAKRKDGDAAVFSVKGPTMEVGSAPIEHPARIDTKVKASELKVGLSKKGVSLQEAVLSAEGSLTLFEGMKVRVKLGVFEAKIPIDYSLLKLTVEGEASDVHWFDALLGEAASLVRVEVKVSGSIAIDKALLAKIIAELLPLEKAAEKVATITAEVEETRRKLEAAKKAHLAADAKNAIARKAEGTASRAKKVASNAERAAKKAESVAGTAEARAAAQAEGRAARAALATARADVKAAQIASNATAKLMSVEKAAIRQQRRALVALLPRLKSATSAMETAGRGIKGMLAKQIGARIGKALATRAGQTLLKALPVIGWVLVAKDVYDIASWLIHLPWEGGGFFGEDGAGAGDGGTPAANPGPSDAAAPAPADGVDANGGDADRGVDGAGTTGTDPTGRPTPTPTATPTTAAPAPATKSTALAVPPAPAPMTQIPAPTPSGGHDDHATKNKGQGKHGNGGSGSGSGDGSGSGSGSGSTATASEPKQPTTVSATGSSAPTGDTATGKTPDVTPKSADGSHSDGESVDHDAQDSADHDAKDAAAHDAAADGRDVATSASQQTTSAPTLAQAKELKRKAKAKAERKAKAAAEAAERKKAANETADRRLFWGGDKQDGSGSQILDALHWDGTTLTKNVSVLNVYVAAMQQRPKIASNGARVALRRMEIRIGKPMGTQILVEVGYLAEQQQGLRWERRAQDVQSLLFDIPSKQLRVAGISMHAVLFDDGVLQMKNGQVVVARKTFTMAGIGTFQVVDPVNAVEKGDHWAVKVKLKPLNILKRDAIFQVAGGDWHELGSAKVKSDGITVTLKHSKN